MLKTSEFVLVHSAMKTYPLIIERNPDFHVERERELFNKETDKRGF